MAKAAASLAEDVASVIGEEVQASRNVGGSSWASCIRVDTGNASYFVKACSGGQAMIEGEAWSLAALHHAAKVRHKTLSKAPCAFSLTKPLGAGHRHDHTRRALQRGGAQLWG